MAISWWTFYVGVIAPASQAVPPSKNLIALVNNTISTVVTIKRVKFISHTYTLPTGGSTGGMVYLNLSRWKGYILNHAVYQSVQVFPVPWDESSALTNDVTGWAGGVMAGTEYVIRPVFWDTTCPQNRQSSIAEVRGTAGKSNIVYGALTDSTRQMITLNPGETFAVVVNNYNGTARNMDIVLDFTCE